MHGRGQFVIVCEKLSHSKGGSKHLLIGLLEDDLAIQEMLRLVFESEGHTVAMYADAQECLASVNSTDQQSGAPSPDLLVVDLHLSRSTSGATVIEQVRANPRLESLPIILMTASAFLDKRELARLRVALLSKPFDIDDITKLVDDLTTGRAKF